MQEDDRIPVSLKENYFSENYTLIHKNLRDL